MFYILVVYSPPETLAVRKTLLPDVYGCNITTMQYFVYFIQIYYTDVYGCNITTIQYVLNTTYSDNLYRCSWMQYHKNAILCILYTDVYGCNITTMQYFIHFMQILHPHKFICIDVYGDAISEP